MAQKKQTEEEKRFVLETKASLASDNEERVIAKLHELKSSGKACLFPSILGLLEQSRSKSVKQEVILLISNIKDQKCVPFIVDFIKKDVHNDWTSRVISVCWQSRLDYSNDLNTFIHCFVSGDYQVALESFTVIEEMLLRANLKSIRKSKKLLVDGISKINAEKKTLYNELIKVLDQGISNSQAENSDL